MQDHITELFNSTDPICPDGRVYLTDRGLSIPHCHRQGICSKDGFIYFIYSRNGKIVRWKRRSMTDKKSQSWAKLEDGDQKTFKTPLFSQFKAPTSDYLIITEGEFDCVALAQLGASNCVSLPSGSGGVESALRDNYEYLQQFSKIYIAFDMDKCGEDAAKKAMAMISPSKYRRLRFPAKDANEWIQKHYPVEMKDLELLMDNSTKVENPCFTALGDLPDSFYDPVDLGISSGWSRLDEVLGGVRVGEITVVTADTGSGKSTFCLNFFKNLADMGKGVWINSYEMSPIMTNRKLASVVLQKPMKCQDFSPEEILTYKKWLKDKHVYLNISNSKVDIKILRDLFEMASLAYGVKYILLDHLDYIHGNGKRSSVLENIDEAMREIHTLALEFNVGVVLVVHPTKKKTEDAEVTMNDLKGSSAIKQYADNILIVTRMDRSAPFDRRVKITISKNRLFGRESHFFLRYVPETDGYTESY